MRIKSLKITLIVFIIAITIGGCVMIDNYLENRNNNTPEAVQEQMLKHMYDKYGVEFVVIDFEPNYNSLVSRLVVYPVGGNPETDRADVFRRRTGDDPGYSDDFFGRLIREDVEAEINKLCLQLSLSSKVFYSNRLIYDNKYDSTKGYIDLKNDGNPMGLLLRISILFEEDMDTEDLSNKLFNSLEEEGLKGTMSIYFITREAFEMMDRGNARNILSPFESHVIARHDKLISRAVK